MFQRPTLIGNQPISAIRFGQEKVFLEISFPYASASEFAARKDSTVRAQSGVRPKGMRIASDWGPAVVLGQPVVVLVRRKKISDWGKPPAFAGNSSGDVQWVQWIAIESRSALGRGM